MLHTNFRNTSVETRVFPLSDKSVSFDPLSESIDSDFEGFNSLGMFTTINRCRLGKYCNLGVSSYASDAIIGPYSLIGSRVSVGGFNHPTNHLAIGAFQWGQGLDSWGKDVHVSEMFNQVLKPKNFPTFLGADCWVGNNAVILQGVKLGVGVIVGAGSVVTKDLPSYSIAVGNPARIIKYRFDDPTIQELLQSSWWELPVEELASLSFTNVKADLIHLRGNKQINS
jgi:virginiamycin A acetyltransferase